MISKREYDAAVDEQKTRIVSDFVGNTPFVKLSEKLYAKLESVNPGGSIKDRPVKWILDKSEKMGLIAKGSVEEKILQLQQEKQALLADLIDIDSLDSQKINLKEVESLLLSV